MIQRIEKQSLRPKISGEPIPDWIPHTIHNVTGIFAKCPNCNRITAIRVCYGCKELMCENCLAEHQINCLHK